MEKTQRQCHRLKSVLPNKHRALLLVAAAFTFTIGSRLLRADTAPCSGQNVTLPFNDVPASNIFFCSIAQAYFTGLTNGTTPTTYGPTQAVPREQMAAFITRTMDQSLKRGNKRAIMEQWSTPGDTAVLRSVGVGSTPRDIMFDGQDLWVANNASALMASLG